jgi:iron-sulfur cluster repair protein YtfE (RIC family)
MTDGSMESREDAWRRRTGSAGRVDFTLMYAAHDAFNRDLSRLFAAAAVGGGTRTEDARATWAMFSEQLHIHHNAEDTALWPRLREAVAGEAEHGVLDAMEQEHAALDPLIERVDAAFAGGAPTVLASALAALGHGVSGHMRHEEEAALPLLERHLGQAGWDAFGREIRTTVGGLSGAARYLPWVLDEADERARTAVLKQLPLPARLLHRRVWQPKYAASPHLS